MKNTEKDVEDEQLAPCLHIQQLRYKKGFSSVKMAAFMWTCGGVWLVAAREGRMAAAATHWKLFEACRPPPSLPNEAGQPATVPAAAAAPPPSAASSGSESLGALPKMLREVAQIRRL